MRGLYLHYVQLPMDVMVSQIAHVYQSQFLFNAFVFVYVVIAMYVFLLFVGASSVIGIDRSFFFIVDLKPACKSQPGVWT